MKFLWSRNGPEGAAELPAEPESPARKFFSILDRPWDQSLLVMNNLVPWQHCLSRAILAGMANGQVVLVTTERLEGGPPVRSVYYVAEEDPAKAEAIVGAVMAPNERVEALGSLPEAAVRALGLQPGDFTHT